MNLFNCSSHLDKDQYWLEYTPQKNQSNEVYVMLHGFPSWQTKNEDIAQLIAAAGHKVYLPHHIGLGFSKGIFSFKRSINETNSFIKFVRRSNKGKKINVIGHSWGGFLSLAIDQTELNNALLIAPLIEFPEKQNMDKLVESLYVEYPEDCSNYKNLQEMINEWDLLKKEYNFLSQNYSLQYSKALIIHGQDDEVIPHSASSRFCETHPKKLFFRLLNDDHLLCLNRRKTLETIKTWIG